MQYRNFALAGLAVAVILGPVGVAMADDGPAGSQPITRAVRNFGPPRVGDSSPAGGGTIYQLPLAGSGIDPSKNIPGLSVPYGAATGGLFPSPPTDPTSGYVQLSATNQRPSIGEIDSYMSSDGHIYYRVVNRGHGVVTYSH